ncbi:MAG TPA: LamG-like jellyroll fold domain-containing protein, partial [Methylomirabilota bacterium]|nr:LamG-like jellyroll fold domain-containing protein [Methylomirabilota bacterium]
TKASGKELIAKLGGENTTQSHLAWQAIGDREMKELTPELKTIVGDHRQSPGRRIAALWALEGLDEKERFSKGADYLALLKPLLTDTNRNIRREAVRVLGSRHLSVAGASHLWIQLFDALEVMANDPDPEVRAELIKTTASLDSTLHISSDSRTAQLSHERALPLLISMAKPPLAEPTMKSTQNGRPIKVAEAYEREFERYLVRMLMERNPAFVASFFDTESAKALPVESRLVAALALEPKASAGRVAELLPSLTRAVEQEELLRLAQFPDEPRVADALKSLLRNVATRQPALEGLIRVRTRLDAAKLTPLLTEAALTLWSEDATSRELAVRLSSAFKLASLEPHLIALLRDRVVSLQQQGAVLRALRDMNSAQVELFANVAKESAALRDDALSALTASKNERAPALALELWPELNVLQRRAALASLTSSKNGGSAVVQAIKGGSLPKADVDAATLDKLHVVLGDDPELVSLMSEMASLFRPVLRLDGKDTAWADTDITLDGPFTVESWVKLDGGIDNKDGILGAPGVLDMNFFGGQFRVWVGGEIHDAIVAKKKMTADVWTHIAVARASDGKFRIYLNGEMDTDSSKTAPQKFEHLRVGWTAPAQGTAGWLSEFRIWDRARSADEIRGDFDRSFEGEARPSRLVHYFTGTNWSKLQPGAKVVKTSDFPPLLNAAEAKVLAQKFERFRELAGRNGDVARGKTLFGTACISCHAVAGQGGQVGPVLNGAGASGVEALLRNVLTPSAAMEAGYRIFRVELKDGDVVDGIFVSQDKEAIVLRRPNVDDTRIAIKDVRRAEFTNHSMMPEGLLEALPPEQVTDLFAYLKTLK